MSSHKGHTYGFYELAPRLAENRWYTWLHSLELRIVRSFRGVGLLFFVIALIVSQATLLTYFSPVAPAFYLAVRRRAPAYVWSTLAGSLLGAMLTRQWQLAFAWSLLAALAVGWHVEHANLRTWKDYATAALSVYLLSVVSFGVAELAWEFNMHSVVVASLHALLTVGATLLLWPTPEVLSAPDKLRVDRLMAWGWGLLALATGLLIGLSALEIGPLQFGKLWLHVIILTAAWSLGPSRALAVSVLLGSVAALTNLIDLGWLGAYSFACLLAGWFRVWGKPGVLLAYFAGIVLLTLPFELTISLQDWVSFSASIILFGLLPMHWLLQPLQAVGNWLRQNDLWHSERDGHHVDFVLSGGYDLVKRLEHFAEVFRQIAYSFRQAAPAETERETYDMAVMIESVSQLACNGCPVFQTCWQKEFFQTYQSIAEQFGRVENSRPPVLSGFRPNRRVICHRPSDVGRTIYFLHQLASVEQRWEEHLFDVRRMVAAQLEGVSGLLQEMAYEETEGYRSLQTVTLQREPYLDYEWGVAKLAKQGSVVSGDSHTIRENKGQLMMLLSDGMGAGARAAMESSAALALLEKMLDLGFSIDKTIRLVNTVLVLRSPDEMFATLDLALINLYDGQAQLMKIGAAATFIKRGSRVAVIRSQSLPLGILHSIDVETEYEQLEPGDYVVMVSDGLLDARKDLDDKESWIQQFLSDCSEVDPQELAERLLQEASAFIRNDEHDDMTVMVARMMRNHYA